MFVDKTIVVFEWDQGNLDKNYRKHGITPNEAEEVFLDKNILIVTDIKHSLTEVCQSAVGKTVEGKILFVVFTKRGGKVRIISARKSNRKERSVYENKT